MQIVLNGTFEVSLEKIPESFNPHNLCLDQCTINFLTGKATLVNEEGKELVVSMLSAKTELQSAAENSKIFDLVTLINKYQGRDDLHPLTCVNCNDAKLVPVVIRNTFPQTKEKVVLRCPNCDYEQEVSTRTIEMVCDIFVTERGNFNAVP